MCPPVWSGTGDVGSTARLSEPPEGHGSTRRVYRLDDAAPIGDCPADPVLGVRARMVSRSDPLPATLTRSRGLPRVEPETLRRYAPLIAAFAVSRLVILVTALLVEAGTFIVNPRLIHGDPAPILRSLTM